MISMSAHPLSFLIKPFKPSNYHKNTRNAHVQASGKNIRNGHVILLLYISHKEKNPNSACTVRFALATISRPLSPACHHPTPMAMMDKRHRKVLPTLIPMKSLLRFWVR